MPSGKDRGNLILWEPNKAPEGHKGPHCIFLYFWANRTVVLNKHNGVLHLLDVIQLTLSALGHRVVFVTVIMNFR